jgi:hypothetical protein
MGVDLAMDSLYCDWDCIKKQSGIRSLFLFLEKNIVSLLQIEEPVYLQALIFEVDLLHSFHI